VRRKHPDFESEPFRVTWVRKTGYHHRTRTYASEADARNALAAPFGADVREAVLDRMELTGNHPVLVWSGVRMASRSRRPTDKR
jgi:hypothetical protein